MKRWKDNRDAISPNFPFSATARKGIYTTNGIESLHSTYRKLHPAKRISKQYSPIEDAVPDNFWSYEKMDDADKKLGAGLWEMGEHVWRASYRIRKEPSGWRQPVFLDMPIYHWYIESRGEKLILKPFAHHYHRRSVIYPFSYFTAIYFWFLLFGLSGCVICSFPSWISGNTQWDRKSVV